MRQNDRGKSKWEQLTSAQIGREKVGKETHSEHKIEAEKSKCFSQIIKTGILQDTKLDTG